MPEIIRRTHSSSASMIVENPILDRVFKNRGLTAPDDIDYNLQHMEDYNQMADIHKASEIIADAVESNQRIICVGDYDADGATSTAIVIRAMRMFGSTNARFIVPDRFKMGYGLTPLVVDLAAEHRPDLMITVDNGISSHDGVEAVKQLPWPCKIVVTDHHLVPDKGIPDADAVINPQREDCGFGSKNIAGCGVAFMTMLATRDRLRERGYFNDQRPEPKMARLLDLVALGLMADVVPLDKNNRILIANGLKVVNSKFCSPGIHALLEVGGRLKGGPLISTDLSFCVAPRLNAAGRLEKMDLGINALLEDDPERAKVLAQQLDSLNAERKEIEQNMKEHAMFDLTDFGSTDNYTICVYNPEFHEGVQGIVASRIKEAFYRPVICFSKAEDGMIKGSGRSIPGFHLKHALDAVNAHFETPLIPKYGGHAMAAGLSIPEENFERFCEALEAEARKALSPDQLIHRIETDGEITAEEMSLDTALEIESMGPWGQHFEEPSFDAVLDIESKKVLQGKHLKMVVKDDSGQRYDAIAFNCVSDTEPLPEGRQQFVFKLSVNRFRGEEKVQLMVEHFSCPRELNLDVNQPTQRSEDDGISLSI